MLTNGGNNERLFRAAWSFSGAPIPVGSYAHGQKWYDGAVAAANCTRAVDTLACLRAAPYEALYAYILTTPGKLSYQSLPSAWLPRVDGAFLEDTPPRPCWNVKAVPSSKGCLTPAAKVCTFRVPLRLSKPLGLIDLAFSFSYIGPASRHAG